MISSSLRERGPRSPAAWLVRSMSRGENGGRICVRAAQSLIRIMAGSSNRTTMFACWYSPTMESIMAKRSSLDAIYAESLVFESNFGRAEGPATGSSQEVAKRTQAIPAWSAAALACETIKTKDPRA